MLTNADITLYNRYYNKNIRLDEYRRTVIRGVHFYVDNKVTVTTEGLRSADVYKVRIPVSADSGGAVFVSARDYKGEWGTWTLQADDYIVRGVLETEIERPAELHKEAEQVFRITSWSDNRFGSLPHWRVGGG